MFKLCPPYGSHRGPLLVDPLTPALCLELLAFTRFSIPFRIFILKILHSINLVHMAVRSLRSTPQPHIIRCLEFPSRSTLSFAALCFCSLRVSLSGLHPSGNSLPAGSGGNFKVNSIDVPPLACCPLTLRRVGKFNAARGFLLSFPDIFAQPPAAYTYTTRTSLKYLSFAPQGFLIFSFR